MRIELEIALLAVAGSFVSAYVTPPRQPVVPVGGGDKLITYSDVMPSSKFRTRSTSVNWARGGADGEFFSLSGNGTLTLEHIVTRERRTLVSGLITPSPREYWLSGDQKHILFSTNATGQYRYSYFANYFLIDVDRAYVQPLVDDQAGDLQYGEMSPQGDAVAFVRGNNLFVRKDGAVQQVTTDGGPARFHGVPDWVYEEEILGDKKALWWSPDGQYLAFLTFDEAGVQSYTVDYYMNSEEIASSYPRELVIRYPKVGSQNPRIGLNIYDVQSQRLRKISTDAFRVDDLIIGEVAWVTRDHSALLFRAYNRVQDQEKVVLVDAATGSTKVVRERDGSDGWLDNNMDIRFIGPLRDGDPDGDWYLDTSDELGWRHIFLFSVDGKRKVALTSGNWEVTGINKLDTNKKLVYYTATKGHSTERHIYAVSYDTGVSTSLVDDSVPAVWSASFSSKGGYYILSYRGPDVPYQELYATDKVAAEVANTTEEASSSSSSQTTNSTTSIFLRVVENNDAFLNFIKDYRLPNTTFLELAHPDGFTLNVMQRLPAKFNPTKKYPSIFLPYGGPGSTSVSKTFPTPGWEAYLASDPELEYVSYVVDGRGTGLKGRAFRAAIAKQMGKLEAADQIWAASQLLERNAFLDADKVAMFGWSFGGYLTAKVLEADSGVFSFGAIVAPVTDWRLYDSMYTERYMKTLSGNAAGYDETAVRKPEGFKNARGGAAIFHGMGDDNVHYQNSAALVDLLVGAGVPPTKLRWYAFTDSTHGMGHNGAYEWLYKALTGALYEERTRTESLLHQWSRRMTQWWKGHQWEGETRPQGVSAKFRL